MGWDLVCFYVYLFSLSMWDIISLINDLLHFSVVGREIMYFEKKTIFHFYMFSNSAGVHKCKCKVIIYFKDGSWRLCSGKWWAVVNY